MNRRRFLVTCLAGAVAAPFAAEAVSAEPVGVVTELHVREGRIEIKPSDGDGWQVAKPLRSLRPGDQIRAIGPARSVIVLAGTSDVTVITATNSPFVVPAPRQSTLVDRAKSTLREGKETVAGERKKAQVRVGAVSSLQTMPGGKTYKEMAVRSVRAQPPIILAPRDTRVLPGALAFDWAGSDRLKYSVKLRGPQGAVLWERANVQSRPVSYPATAPKLAPSARYTWELSTREHGVQKASFEVASVADTARVTEALGALAPGTAESHPPVTLALMRAGLLFKETLYADARRELVTAIGTSPDEPTLHLVLGHVYDRTGLLYLASSEFDQATALAAPR